MKITRGHDTRCVKSKDKCKCICLKCKNDHQTCCFGKDLPCPLTECTRFAPETSEKQEKEEAKEVITNYEKLFGTPERSAQTLRGKCYFCALEKKVCIGNECDEGILEYLNQEARK